MKLAVAWDEDLYLRWFGRRVKISWSILLLLLGAGIFFLLAVETIVIWFIAPELVFPIVRGVIAEILTGRESGIAVFLEGGVPPLLTMQYSAMQDLVTSFVVFPVYVFLLTRYHDRDNFVMRSVRRIQRKAQKHKKRVQRQGPVYLFFFMLVPFMVNGPLVGLMIGRLVNIRMSVLVTIVVAATVVPAVAWTLFYNTLFRITEQFMPAAPSYITIGVVSFVAFLIIVGSITERVMEARRKKKQGEQGEGDEKDEGGIGEEEDEGDKREEG